MTIPNALRKRPDMRAARLVRRDKFLLERDTARRPDPTARLCAYAGSAQVRLAVTAAAVTEALCTLGQLEDVARLSGGKVPSQAELAAGRAAVAPDTCTGATVVANGKDWNTSVTSST